MITSFKSRETQLIFQGRISVKYPRSIQVDALRKLRIIDAATSIGDLQILGCPERLSSSSENYSLAIDNRWQIQFTWIEPDEATEVDIVGDFGMGSRRNRLPNIHPGAVLQADLMQPLGLSIDRLSTESGMTQDTLLGVLEGRVSIDASIAAQLASYFGNSQEFWRNLQRQFDSAQSSSTSTMSDRASTVLDRLQDIFHQDDDDLDELDDEPPSRYGRRRCMFDTDRPWEARLRVRLDDDINRDDTRSSDRRDRHIYFRDRERDLNNRVSLPRPLSDFELIEVDGKLSISIDELMAAGIIFDDNL
jgi:addiction module HigA family antidote